ncbi:hypothetical protein EMCRGX_G027444 [Ephydatia muelleri]
MLSSWARGSKDETLHMGTSKAAEGEGLNKLFEQASNEGMHISAHVQDNDSSSIVALREHFKDDTTSVMLFAGHCNRAQQKRLKLFAKSKKCSAKFIKDYIKQYPTVETVKCHCTKHKNIARLKKTDYIKTVECKRKRNRWKTQHRTYEQDERKNNLKRRKVYHTYGDEEVNESNDEIEENADELECKPKNKIKKQRKGSIKYVDKEISKGNGEIEIDEDDESLTEQCCHLCKCPNPPSHTHHVRCILGNLRKIELRF